MFMGTEVIKSDQFWNAFRLKTFFLLKLTILCGINEKAFFFSVVALM